MLGVLPGAINEISHHNRWQLRPRKILLCPERFRHTRTSSSALHCRMLLTIDCHKDMERFYYWERVLFFAVSFVLTNISWPSSSTVSNLGSWFQVFWGNNETNLIYSLAKKFCNDFRVHPWAHRFRKARVRYEVGVWSSTEDVPGEVIFIKVDIPGAYVASSCEVLSWVQDALSHCFLDDGQQCCHTGFNQLYYVISLIGLRRAGWLLVGLPYATALRCGSRPG